MESFSFKNRNEVVLVDNNDDGDGAIDDKDGDDNDGNSGNWVSRKVLSGHPQSSGNAYTPHSPREQ